MDRSVLNSARLKVQRADRHIQDVQILLEEFGSSQFYELVVDYSIHAVVPRLLKPFPDDVPFIIGDCVHNLKSALDHAFTALAGGGVRAKDLMFPFAKERKSLISDRARLDDRPFPGLNGSSLMKYSLTMEGAKTFTGEAVAKLFGHPNVERQYI